MNKRQNNSISPKSILCVEDNRDTCEMLSVLLSDYEFVSAHDCAEAYAKIEQRSFDLYILDNWLPDGSGIDICKKIRAASQSVPIIFVSGVGDRANIDRAKNAGANEYLIKPCEPEEIERIVKELID